MKTVLFLHGFYASGSCVPAMAIVKAFENAKIRILTPDLPLHPTQAISLIRQICDKEKPDLLVGNSCGSFYAQLLSPIVGIPALIGNPHFQMSRFLKDRIGENRYKSIRRDGKQEFIIDEQLIKEFEELEITQFNYTNPFYRDKVWGLFGEKDTLANFRNLFQVHYNQLYSFPGNHTPTEEEVRTWYVPLTQNPKMASVTLNILKEVYLNIYILLFMLRLMNGWLYTKASLKTKNTGFALNLCFSEK